MTGWQGYETQLRLFLRQAHRCMPAAGSAQLSARLWTASSAQLPRNSRAFEDPSSLFIRPNWSLRAVLWISPCMPVSTTGRLLRKFRVRRREVGGRLSRFVSSIIVGAPLAAGAFCLTPKRWRETPYSRIALHASLLGGSDCFSMKRNCCESDLEKAQEEVAHCMLAAESATLQRLPLGQASIQCRLLQTNTDPPLQSL